MVDKKLNKYYWIIGVVVITIILMILAIVFLIAPSFRSINKVNKELKDQKEQLATLETKLEKLKVLKVKEKELKEQSDIVYRAIPTKKEIGELFIQLHTIIKESGGDHTKASTAQSSQSTSTNTTAPEGISTLIYDSEISLPNYQNFKTMLSASEKALRFIHLNTFTIAGEGNFKVTLKYKAYYRSENISSGGEQ